MIQTMDDNQLIAYMVPLVTVCRRGCAPPRRSWCCAESAITRVTAVPLHSGRSTPPPPPLEEAPPRADERKADAKPLPATGVLTNHKPQRLIRDRLTGQWHCSPAPPASLQNSEACSQQHRSTVSWLQKMFCINGRTRLDSSCRARVCSWCDVSLSHMEWCSFVA